MLLGYELRARPSYTQSLLRSLKATFTITLAVLPLVLMGTALIYFELRTGNLCSEWQAIQNHTLSFDVMRIKLIGKGVEKMIVYLCFPYWVVLFGWSEFKRHYSSTILVGQLAALVKYIIFKFFTPISC